MILFLIVMYIFYRMLNPYRWSYYRPYQRPFFFINPFMYRGMRPRGPMYHHHHHCPHHHGFWF